MDIRSVMHMASNWEQIRRRRLGIWRSVIINEHAVTFDGVCVPVECMLFGMCVSVGSIWSVEKSATRTKKYID